MQSTEVNRYGGATAGCCSALLLGGRSTGGPGPPVWNRLGGGARPLAEGLARSGIGRITLVDNDTVAPSNCNRQLVVLPQHPGMPPKAPVMRDRILDINPACQAEALCLSTAPRPGMPSIFPPMIMWWTRIHTVTAKLLVIQRAKAAGLPVISSMGTGNKLYLPLPHHGYRQNGGVPAGPGHAA